MRAINLKSGDFDGRGLLAELVRFSADVPYTIDELRSAVTLLGRIESANGDELLLEEAEHEFLCVQIGRARFVRADAQVLTILDAVLQAPKVKVRAVTGGN